MGTKRKNIEEEMSRYEIKLNVHSRKTNISFILIILGSRLKFLEVHLLPLALIHLFLLK